MEDKKNHPDVQEKQNDGGALPEALGEQGQNAGQVFENAEPEEVTQSAFEESGVVDEEAIRAIRREWRRERKIKRLTPVNTLLMLGVAAFVPWYVWSVRQDLSYFFSSSTPVELNVADDYRFAPGEASKTQDFPDNRYVHIEGIPIRHVAIQTRGNPIQGNLVKLVYQLMGSSVYIEEPAEGSKFAQFQSQTTTSFQPDAGIRPIDIRGRLRRFDTAEAKQYAPVRDYYAKQYGTIFCQGMSDGERRRKAALLGRGGVTVQIMPDGAAIQAETDTHATLVSVTGLDGRAAMALGNDNTLLHTIDAGLTWRKSALPDGIRPTTVAFDAQNRQILFAGKDGWMGANDGSGASKPAFLSQDILDIAFVTPDDVDVRAPRVIAVGREGLLEVAHGDREGWLPARIDDDIRFNDVLRVGSRWFVAGNRNMLMHRDSLSQPWIEDVSPVHANWTGLLETPDFVVATGSGGAVARYPTGRSESLAAWETWPVDDVPGIDFNNEIRASAISDDHKTWVGVGQNGAIVVAKAGDDGKFGRIERISASYAGYGVVRDILAGNAVSAALYEACARFTQEDLNDITYYDGTFYAVGSGSLLMTSNDGLSWQKRTLHVKNKILRAIVFTADGTGVIGGEKGMLLTSPDRGKSWKSRQSPTERSIYQLRVSKDYPEGFVFTGAYGLWGYCPSQGGRCLLRAKTGKQHYRAIAFDQGRQMPGHMRLVAVGDEGRVDLIEDRPSQSAVKTPLYEPRHAGVFSIAAADEELPLLPNETRGQIALVAADDGMIYRSFDGGYTFRAEQTGQNMPLRRLAMTSDGSRVWGFDHHGHAIEDIRSRAKWHALTRSNDPSKSFRDGLFIGQTGYLIDSACLFATQGTSSEISQQACVGDKNFELERILRWQDRILLAGHDKQFPHKIQFATYSPKDSSEIRMDVGLKGIELENAQDMRLIGCNDGLALIARDGRLHYRELSQNSDWEHKDGVVDAACLDGRLTVLQTASDAVRPHVVRLLANRLLSGEQLWVLDTVLDAKNIRFMRNAQGRWWVAASSENQTFPVILMSNDGKHWSWRRDRLTDFHAVATAGAQAVAVGDAGTILVSQDYGLSWVQIPTSTKQTLRDVCISQDGTFAIAVGDAGTVYRSQNQLTRWSKLKYKLDFDITSCAIAEQKNRFQVYIAGKGGAIYTAQDASLGKLDLIASPAVEDIYSLAALQTGEVIAVGGNYQDPATICEEGFLIQSDVTPRSLWKTLAFVLALVLFWLWNVKTLVISIRYRNRNPYEDLDLTPKGDLHQEGV